MTKENELIESLKIVFDKYDTALAELGKENVELKDRIRRLEARLNTPKDTFKA